jgi:hypothetical protein
MAFPGESMKRYAAVLLLSSVCAFAQTQPSAKPKPAPVTTPAPVKIDPQKEADIRHLMEVTGASSLATQVMGNMEKNIRPLMTNALPPGDYREQLVELFFQKYHQKRDPNRVIDMAVPVYDKYYSDDEIKGLIQFYSTPLGKKALTVMPQLMGELQNAGSEYGKDLGRQCMLEVLAEHPEMAKALEQAGKAQQHPQ